MHQKLAAYILAILSYTPAAASQDVQIVDLHNCTAAQAKVDETPITITAAHCKRNWITIAPDLAWQTSTHTTHTTLDEPKDGPAIAHTRRGNFNVTLTDERYVGYIVTRDWTPIPGDSGSPITQNGSIVAIVSWRAIDGSHGGHHRITRQQIEAIRKQNRPLPTVPKLRIMPRLRRPHQTNTTPKGPQTMPTSIPLNTQSATLAWAENFRDVVVAAPASYNMTVGQAGTVNTLVVAYRAAWNLAGVENGVAVDPANYTKPNRDALYAARQAMLDQVRTYTNLIQQNPAIADALKIAAGVAPKNYGRSPRNLPSSSPVLAVVGYAPLQHTLSFYQSDNPSLKRLPDNAIAMNVYAVASTTPITNPEELFLIGQFERSPLVIPQYSSDAGGKQAYYAARWVGTRRQLGNWSAIINATVPTA